MDTGTLRWSRLRRFTGAVLAVALLSGVIVVGDAATTTTTASADALSGTGSANPSYTPPPPTQIGGGGQGAACDPSPASPARYCGYASFSSNGRCNATRVTADGLPPNARHGKTTSTRDSWNGLVKKARPYYDYVSGTNLTHCPVGATWVDEVTFTSVLIFTWGPGAYAVVDRFETVMRWNALTFTAYEWTNETDRARTVQLATQDLQGTVITYKIRTVTYTPVYRKAPVEVSRFCPTSIGKNSDWPYLVGPYGNSATPWPVYDAPGKVNPLTDVRKWTQAPKYSSIGMQLETNRGVFVKGNDTALSLVLNCGKLTYNFVPKNDSCYYPQSATTRTSGTDVCTFTPGNYQKQITPYGVTCKYAYYPDSIGGVTRGTMEFLSCGTPANCSGNSLCTGDDGWAHVLCGEVGNAKPGKAADTYNFANCKPTAIRCVWSDGSGNPTLTDPYGVRIGNGPQVLADGKQWRVTWPSLTITGAPSPIKGQWVQFIVADKSQPVRAGSSVFASDQPVLGSTTAGGTSSSDLTRLPSSRGESGWPRTLYMNFYGASSVATSQVVVGQGQVANPITVPRGSLTPYGVYAVYRFYIDETIRGYDGSMITKPAPYSCSTRMASFYPVTGRVTG